MNFNLFLTRRCQNEVEDEKPACEHLNRHQYDPFLTKKIKRLSLVVAVTE